MPLAPGEMFERYEIEGLVGRGGMGEVYRAVDTRLHRPVALKVIRSDAEAQELTDSVGGVQRLLREARAAAALNHANSVSIYELGEAEGIPYIAMEFVSGRTIRQFIGDDATSLEQKLLWMIDAANALSAAHRAHLVHRDVKPGNIMVSTEGIVKVLDFGLAKPLKPSMLSPSEFQTQMGQVLGTPRYMSPEQLEGTQADATTDQYAFGIVAYELLSGVYPGGPLAGSPRPIHEICAAASPELSAVLTRMLKRRAGERFATMDDVVRALKECLPSINRIQAAPVASAEAVTTAPMDQDVITRAFEKVAQRERERHSMAKTAPMQRVLDLNHTMPLATPIVVPTPSSPSRVPAAPSSGQLPIVPTPAAVPVVAKPKSMPPLWIAIVVLSVAFGVVASAAVLYLRR